ncbi:ABC transporter ATP-binding protein [Bradyrhizobium sp. U87765 SZCCT0131]|uniref:ABC transporter ATP-binding protein n=1 Tax=unclassified Bradyrhizobium TaxID=2631580 RepID=UPI001BA72EC7|nr:MULTISPECIES: ABC transporter ATP-binding protein [unclassified Bradyrhizobium]MBR1218001.1 ABC transporter ATP-binding protein [Bradyrhizobium sp. U87765 SZCCT0131]MBR1261053.1 ABC transporter ATP-binding protein [Bradyrhizobium sp. U87765 SZCCT0134]MBR1303499.1 ABC transporter ATP-binding protein [Bradyrhizobium sp. U87765 SZCCT0110]MBR1319105.1 ABC transporter ATP-binding protein [Bradyrhizobium sp. U87765 SZCCT0109]MBR1347430.1 ABC transporter ATP-binding protein [Bradyrhizobium sp. U87
MIDLPHRNGPLLDVRDLHAWYDESKALHGVEFDVAPGKVVTLLGRNGAGKTSTLRAIMGLLRRKSGVIRFDGYDIARLAPESVARSGVAYCPEERGIFASLTVAENLGLPPVIGPGGMSDADVLALFPNLRDRWSSPGTKLSGGEQQMLAIGRILRSGARLLLLDEPTEGLAPVIVKRIGALISTLRERGYTILLVEQNFRFAARLADRFYIVEHGKVVDGFDRDDLAASEQTIKTYLGV